MPAFIGAPPSSLFFAFPLKTGASYPFQFLQDSEGRLYDVEGTSRTTYWYNSGVKRAIRWDTHNSSNTGKVYVNERIDLERYEVR